MTCKCQIPPEGWACTRYVGHSGPCAATPIDPIVRLVNFRDGFIMFCENSIWGFFPEKKKPWYTRACTWIKRRMECLVG